jgi:putative ATP-binding cassette transporter
MATPRKWSRAQMADESKKLSGSEAAAAARHEELAPQLWMMITTFFHSPIRNTLLALGIAIFAVIFLTAFGQIKLNAWNRPFYDGESVK